MLNKSEIMRAANRYAKTMNRSTALKRAWLEAKISAVEAQLDILSYADHYSASEQQTVYRLDNERFRLLAALRAVAA